jgi:hypothetical protein
VGARYARVSLAINQAIFSILLGDTESASRFIEPHSKNHLADPVIRQRMFCLAILVRVHIARGELADLAGLAPGLASALALRRSTGAHDFQVASYAFALDALGERSAAVRYVKDFVKTARRDRTRPSDELQIFLRESDSGA